MTPDEHDLLLAYLHRELPAEAVAALEGRLKLEPALADEGGDGIEGGHFG